MRAIGKWLNENKGALLIAIGLGMALSAGLICFIYFTYPYHDTIPPDTSLKCKVQDNYYFYAVAQDGELYRLSIEDWVLLDIPACGCE